ncbi:MAG TPA: DUF1192 family protein [Alphaproteobacteria bacterium]|jgi:uncharacterized small protein (DUF1192 family)
MARDDDEERVPPAATRWIEPRPLETLSVAELEAYVLALKAEIARAEAAAAAKREHRAGIEALFGKKS